MEFLNPVLCVIFMSVAGLIQGVCLERMLTPKQYRGGYALRILLWTCGSLFSAVFKVLIPFSGNLIFTVLFAFLALWLGYSDRIVVKISATIYMFILIMAGDLLSSVFILLEIEANYADVRFMVGCMLAAAVSIVFQMVGCNIWCRVRKGSKGIPHIISLVIIYTIVILMIYYTFFTYISAYDTTAVSLICCVFLALCVSTFLLVTQSENHRMDKELQEMKRVSELEKVHYEGIEARREEMAKIRHDYNNVLSAIKTLIDSGDTVQASNMLGELSGRIADTKEYPFCSIPIINAILTEKKNFCESKGIIMTADILLPEKLSVNELDICSAFGNLLDNAARECAHGTEKDKKEILLSAGISRSYLVIKCENPLFTTPKKKPEGTGYGMKILKGLADRYNGDFSTRSDQGIFSAQLTLEIKDQ